MGHKSFAGKVEQSEYLFWDIWFMKTDPVSIVLKSDSKPYSVVLQCRMLFPLRQKVKEELDRIMAEAVIKPIIELTDGCAPIVPF